MSVWRSPAHLEIQADITQAAPQHLPCGSVSGKRQELQGRGVVGYAQAGPQGSEVDGLGVVCHDLRWGRWHRLRAKD